MAYGLSSGVTRGPVALAMVMGASSFSTKGDSRGASSTTAASGLSGVVHRVAVRENKSFECTRGIDRVECCRDLLLVSLLRQRRRGERGESNAGRSVHESKAEGTFHPVLLGGAAASIICLES